MSELSRRPKKAAPTDGSNATDGWWYENKGSADVLVEVRCRACGSCTVGRVRILWRALYDAMHRAGFV